MSKKKATMTLKDFHGGSIPSDLRLPSAPGVTVRPVERPGFDRQMSWGNSSGKPDHRIRPASAGSARNLEEKPLFLSHSPHIGLNFDEDERKPLDGMSGPRRTMIDESVRAQPIRIVDPKTDNLSGSRVCSNAASIHSSQSGPTASSYAGKVTEVRNKNSSGNRSYGSNYPVMGGYSGPAVAGSYPNAWGIRKETAGMKDPVPWSAPDVEVKLAHASAIEKVSSGRWNSRQHVHSPKDAEGETGNYKKTYNKPEVVCVSDFSLTIHAEKSPVGDGNLGREKDEFPTFERSRSTVHVDSHERNMSITANGLQSIIHSEPSERPKLKLLPRSKPMENVEPQPTDFKQTSNHLHVEDSYVVHEPMKNPLQSGSPGPVVGDQALERPKLNLKPRSQTLEQLERKIESKRGTVYGGGRPREFVLKERGIEDDVSGYESQSPRRVRQSTPKADTFVHVPPASYHEKVEANPTDQRRNNRPNEIRRNNRDVDKNRNQQLKQDRPPSPDTWRKPVEPDAPSVRYGKAASAVELAQAFSKSVSEPSVGERFAGSRGVSGRGQIPFSRLTGPAPRPQINGY